MFADLPFQGTLDLDAIFSRFDDETNPPNVTTWEASSVDVVFQSSYAAQEPKGHELQSRRRQFHASGSFPEPVSTLKEFDAKRDAIVRLGKQLEDFSTHTFRSFVFPCFSRSMRSGPASTFHGHTRGRNIIIEGMGTLLELAHEVGHALELEHNKRSDGLMLRQPTGIFLTRQDILKIGMLR